MKIKSVAGITCYVKDLDKTANFYETLGFEIKKRASNHVTAYMNWFWIDFLDIAKEDKPEFQKEANLINKGASCFHC